MEIFLKEFLYAFSYVVVFMIIWKVGKFIIDYINKFKTNLKRKDWNRKKISL